MKKCRNRKSKVDVSLVDGRVPTQAVVNLTLWDIGIASETRSANLGHLLSSWAVEMASGQKPRSSLDGIEVVRNNSTKVPWM